MKRPCNLNLYHSLSTHWRFQVEQALAVRVVDRLVAGADEDAFESGASAATGDDDHNGRAGGSVDLSGEQSGGRNSISLAEGIKSRRRRSSAGLASLSVSGKSTRSWSARIDTDPSPCAEPKVVTLLKFW